ncbi:MAG: asparagine--tRNA ligase [Gammaproteobacteria bacterium]|nr:asparagine--tRNA ligase [Gammaproteobacteria bacterium]
MNIRQLFSGKQKGQKVTVRGWVRTFRANRFIALNDGSCLANLQCVVDFEQTPEEILAEINTGAALEISGTLVESQGKGQQFEIQADSVTVLGRSNPDEYPIQPKKHSLEFLREKAHLRVRTNTFAAVMRVRAALSYAVHQYFTENGFYQVHTPIITGSDAEGAGEMFRVTTLDPAKKTDESDFFGKETNLTVSGQLEAETYAMGLGKVYTFGPTFRAENSNTSRHLAEFWMIEPEVAFNDLDDNMDLAEDFIKSVLAYVLENCEEDLAFLDQRFAQEEAKKPQLERSPMGLIERLQFVTQNEFMRVSYTDAIDILRNSKPNKKKKFKYLIDAWGADLQSEHERYLVEKHFTSPVILFDYPAEIKAFYMRMNEDGKTVRAMDVLFPGVGEMVGGSQREERLDKLIERMRAMDIDENELWWYTDLRRFGTAVHAGFGLGFERLVLYTTGMSNIRDVIPYPRTPLNATF